MKISFDTFSAYLNCNESNQFFLYSQLLMFSFHEMSGCERAAPSNIVPIVMESHGKISGPGKSWKIKKYQKSWKSKNLTLILFQNIVTDMVVSNIVQ